MPTYPKAGGGRGIAFLGAIAALTAACQSTSLPPTTGAALPPPTAEATAAPTPAPTASIATPDPKPPLVPLHAGGEHAVRGARGLVTTSEANATHVGAEVLRRGGNAVDAAVAVAFALAVTHPSAGNIGGGGFLVVRPASGDAVAIDFREAAPMSATEKVNRAMLAAGGMGYRSAAVPGTVAGLLLALDRFGTRPLAELVQPAVQLARDGHTIAARQAQLLEWSWPKLQRDAAARAVWGRGKNARRVGALVKQPDLARSLEAIARGGRSAFYEGAIALAIDKAMRANHGLVTKSDLAAYEARVWRPISFTYRGLLVETMPPPSMGGVALAEILRFLEHEHAWEAPALSGLGEHLLIEAARRAYAERRKLGADPVFFPGELPAAITALIGDDHIGRMKPPIDREHATPSSAVVAEQAAEEPESPETTHVSIVDGNGMAVSLTTTQSASFGAKVMVPGTGILLGNAMGGFSPQGPNALAPKKRMASSMTPTIVSQNGKVVLILGSPGGDTIPNTVAQVFRNVVDWGMTIDGAVMAPRIHHQFLPDVVRVERDNPLPGAVTRDLVRRGHKIRLVAAPIGDANSILMDVVTGIAWGFADRRGGGAAEGIEGISAPETTQPDALDAGKN